MKHFIAVFMFQALCCTIAGMVTMEAVLRNSRRNNITNTHINTERKH